MARAKVDITRTKSRGLVGAELEAAIARIEYLHPELVVREWRLADGTRVIAQAVARRSLPRRSGRYAAVDVQELRSRWTAAVQDVRRNAARPTWLAIGRRLGVSGKTASRYAKLYGLTVGDEA